ncbi:MAG: hypothetical protein JKY14_10625, partial [Paraglaciecola sp.]|nr:hypothetical protein [Paraglaciecola sp.]
MPTHRFTFYFAFALAAILFLINQLSMQAPAAKPLSAPDNEFSGERAFVILESLLRENQAHPVGSPLNKKIKQRIITELEKHKIAVSEQQTWSCSYRYNSCAFIENIIAIIPGERDCDYVALMS